MRSENLHRIADGYSPELFWLHAKLGMFEFNKGENTLGVEALIPNSEALPGNLFGLDYIFLIKK